MYFEILFRKLDTKTEFTPCNYIMEDGKPIQVKQKKMPIYYRTKEKAQSVIHELSLHLNQKFEFKMIEQESFPNEVGFYNILNSMDSTSQNYLETAERQIDEVTQTQRRSFCVEGLHTLLSELTEKVATSQISEKEDNLISFYHLLGTSVKHIQEFYLHVVSDFKNNYKKELGYYTELVSQCDDQILDILHYLELKEKGLNASESCHYMKRLREIRLKRRLGKDRIQQLDYIMHLLTTNDLIALSKLNEYYLEQFENRYYNVRQLTEEFGEKMKKI